MTQLLHHGHEAGHWDARTQVDTDHGELADHMERCAHCRDGPLALHRRANAVLSFLRRHFVTIVVLCTILAVATALAM